MVASVSMLSSSQPSNPYDNDNEFSHSVATENQHYDLPAGLSNTFMIFAVRHNRVINPGFVLIIILNSNHILEDYFIALCRKCK